MAQYTLADIDNALKRIYSDKAMAQAQYENSALLAILPKKANDTGESFTTVVDYKIGDIRSSTFGSIPGTMSDDEVSFISTPKEDFSRVAIDFMAALDGSGSKEGHFYKRDVVMSKMEKARKAVTLSLCRSLYRDKVGTIAKVASISGTTLTLENKAEAVYFDPGQVINFTPDSGSSFRGTASITEVNISDGTLEINADPGVVAADEILFNGDANLKLDGLSAWIPYGSTRNTKLAAAFNNVTRSAFAEKLGGHYVDGSALPVSDALRKLKVQLTTAGASCDYIPMHPENLNELEEELEGRVKYEMVSPVNARNVQIGFDAITISGMKAKIIPDFNVPRGVAWMINSSDWQLRHRSANPVNIMPFDGSSGSQFIWRDGRTLQSDVYFYGNLVCNNPFHQGVVLLGNNR